MTARSVGADVGGGGHCHTEKYFVRLIPLLFDGANTIHTIQGGLGPPSDGLTELVRVEQHKVEHTGRWRLRLAMASGRHSGLLPNRR